MFQFHVGSIKTGASRRRVGGGVLFQFHVGSIKTAIFHAAVCCIMNTLQLWFVSIRAFGVVGWQ